MFISYPITKQCLFLIPLQNSVYFISIILALVRSLRRSSQHQTQPEFRENDTIHSSAGEFCIDRMDYWRRGKEAIKGVRMTESRWRRLMCRIRASVKEDVRLFHKSWIILQDHDRKDPEDTKHSKAKKCMVCFLNKEMTEQTRLKIVAVYVSPE